MSSHAGRTQRLRSSRRSGWRRASPALRTPSPTRRVAVCRELTKRFEEVAVGPAAELAPRFAGNVKGEVALVVGPAEIDREVDLVEAVSTVAELIAEGLPRRRAVELVARLAGVSRNRLYQASL